MTNAVATTGIQVPDTINATTDHLIQYDIHDIRALSAQAITCPKTGKKTIESITLDGMPVATTQRFWTSLYSRYGFGKNIFNYFDPKEVFDRIADRRADDSVRFCLHALPGARMHSLLAVSSPTKPVLEYSQIRELLSSYDPLTPSGDDGVTYSNGILRADYAPRGESEFEIVGDKFQPRFSTMIPIDGYGAPETVLGCLRLVCINGMVAIAKMFSNKIPGGSDANGCIERITQVIESYGNDEGYDAFRRRMVAGSESYASVAECINVSQMIGTAMASSGADLKVTRELLDTFDQLAGSPSQFYGLMSENSVGRKRLASLPTKATAYDLINFATEAATHHVKNELQTRIVYGNIGNMLAKEYDLEGSARGNKDHIDILMAPKTNPEHN